MHNGVFLFIGDPRGADNMDAIQRKTERLFFIFYFATQGFRSTKIISTFNPLTCSDYEK